MQSVQRHFGKYMKRTADEGQVSVLLKDFDDADQLLTKASSHDFQAITPAKLVGSEDMVDAECIEQIIEASKAWRDSWISILNYQHRLVNEFEILYAPIIGAGEDYHGHQAVETPGSTMARTIRLREEYEDLKKDLMEEVNMVDTRMIKPAQEAKDYLQPLKKTIKKREDRKLDFERYQSRVDSNRKKTKKTDRDAATFAKAEADLAQATEAYNAADDHLRNSLPRLLAVTFSILPHLLTAQIQIQNTLLAHYYTMLHTYCTEEKFPSPAPPMDEVIRIWDDAFKPSLRDIESIAIIAHGKTARSAMNGNNGTHSETNGYSRRPSGTSMSRVSSVSPARALPPSRDTMPKITSLPSPSASSLLSPAAATPTSESILRSPSPSSYHSTVSCSPAAPNSDYFSRDRQPSTTSLSSIPGLSSSIAQKKKPPPPPPRIPSAQFSFVTALYDFAGQGKGDLVFREGDRIKVLKKTESTDDWWQGELRGVKGSFPANYCQ